MKSYQPDISLIKNMLLYIMFGDILESQIENLSAAPHTSG